MKNSPRRQATTPVGLSSAGKRWFRLLTEQFDVSDAAGRLLLESAMRAFDRAEGARALLDTAGCVLLDRWGQSKPHPAAAVERDARAGMLAALRALNLDVEPLRDAPGRPGGR